MANANIIEIRRQFTPWPASEEIPKSMEDALAQGWEVDGSDVECSEDERTQTGMVYLKKHCGKVELNVTIPFRAILSYGAPRDPYVNDSDAVRKWKTNA